MQPVFLQIGKHAMRIFVVLVFCSLVVAACGIKDDPLPVTQNNT